MIPILFFEINNLLISLVILCQVMDTIAANYISYFWLTYVLRFQSEKASLWYIT